MAISTLAALDSSIYLPLGALCLVMVSAALLRRWQEGRATVRDVTREQRTRLREERDVKASMEELLAQLEHVSRRIDAQVDSGLAKLAAALLEADARIARLPPGDTPPAPVSAKFEAGEIKEVPAATETDRRQRICAMADAGAAPITIADALRIPLGEVELVLDLRKFK